MRALSIAATGMLAQQTNVEVIANNLANMNTTGFKQQRADFQDLLYQNVAMPGANSSDTGNLLPAGIQLGAGVNDGDVIVHLVGDTVRHAHHRVAALHDRRIGDVEQHHHQYHAHDYEECRCDRLVHDLWLMP